MKPGSQGLPLSHHSQCSQPLKKTTSSLYCTLGDSQVTRQGGNGRRGTLKTETLYEGKGLCQKSQPGTKEQLAPRRPSSQPHRHNLRLRWDCYPTASPPPSQKLHLMVPASSSLQSRNESERARACTTEKKGKKNRPLAPSPRGVDKRAIRQQVSISIEKPASASHRRSSGGKIPVLERLKQAIQSSTEQEKNILIPKVGLQSSVKLVPSRALGEKTPRVSFQLPMASNHWPSLACGYSPVSPFSHMTHPFNWNSFYLPMEAKPILLR